MRDERAAAAVRARAAAASCARRRTIASAWVENTSTAPVNSATSASTLRFTRYEREMFAARSMLGLGTRSQHAGRKLAREPPRGTSPRPRPDAAADPGDRCGRSARAAPARRRCPCARTACRRRASSPAIRRREPRQPDLDLEGIALAHAEPGRGGGTEKDRVRTKSVETSRSPRSRRRRAAPATRERHRARRRAAARSRPSTLSRPRSPDSRRRPRAAGRGADRALRRIPTRGPRISMSAVPDRVWTACANSAIADWLTSCTA